MRLVKIACLLFLLAAGTVEAGEHHRPGDTWPAGDGCNICEMHPDGMVGCTLAACNITQNHGTWSIEPGDTSCYQRMQEAMRMMRLTVDAAYRGSIVTATPQPSPTPKEIWDATMKECVQ